MAHSPAPDQGTDTTRNALYRRITLRLIPFIFICYLFNYLDRVNVGFAKLQMLDALKFSETVYGLGAGIFFIGYVLCGLPSNLALNRFGPRRWIALMMIAWGSLSTCLLFVTTPTEFYTLRLLTGAAEAGFFPGVVLYLFQGLGMSAKEVETVLYKRSGLLGISGFSNDMRDLLASDAASARLAIDYFVYRAAREIGALAAVLGGFIGSFRSAFATAAAAASRSRKRASCC
mgnify:CR=1 FL=1